MRTALTVAATAALIASVGLASAAPGLQCKQGPITRSFGGSEWHVYACDDQKSLAVTVIKATPQLPFFYFFVSVSGGGVEVVGEGNGDKALTEPAYRELTKLKLAEVASLVAEARRTGPRP